MFLKVENSFSILQRHLVYLLWSSFLNIIEGSRKLLTQLIFRLSLSTSYPDEMFSVKYLTTTYEGVTVRDTCQCVLESVLHKFS